VRARGARGRGAASAASAAALRMRAPPIPARTGLLHPWAGIPLAGAPGV